MAIETRKKRGIAGELEEQRDPIEESQLPKVNAVTARQGLRPGLRQVLPVNTDTSTIPTIPPDPTPRQPTTEELQGGSYDPVASRRTGRPTRALAQTIPDDTPEPTPPDEPLSYPKRPRSGGVGQTDRPQPTLLELTRVGLDRATRAAQDISTLAGSVPIDLPGETDPLTGYRTTRRRTTLGEIGAKGVDWISKAMEWYGKNVGDPQAGIVRLTGLGGADLLSSIGAPYGSYAFGTAPGGGYAPGQVSTYRPEELRKALGAPTQSEQRQEAAEQIAKLYNAKNPVTPGDKIKAFWEAAGEYQEQRPEAFPGEKLTEGAVFDATNLLGFGITRGTARTIWRGVSTAAGIQRKAQETGDIARVASRFEDAVRAGFAAQGKLNPTEQEVRDGILELARAVGGETRAARYTPDMLEDDLVRKYNLSPEEASHARQIADAHAAAWAEITGKTPEEWYDTRLAGVTVGIDGRVERLLQAAPDSDFTPLFSKAQRAVDKVISTRVPQSGVWSTDNWIREISKQDITKEELTWTGLLDYLNSKPKGAPISSTDIQDYLRANKIRVRELILPKAGDTAQLESRVSQLRALSRQKYRDIYRALWSEDAARLYFPEGGTQAAWESIYHEGGVTLDAQRDIAQNPDRLITYIQNGWIDPDEIGGPLGPALREYRDLGNQIQDLEIRIANGTRGQGVMYEKYNLPGDYENYHELLFHWVPDDKGTVLYSSGHFAPNNQNLLAHARYNVRTLPDGSKVFFVEEIQSDWHQAGRDLGYGGLTLKPEYHMEYYSSEYLDKLYGTEQFARAAGLDRPSPGWMLVNNQGEEFLRDTIRLGPGEEAAAKRLAFEDLDMYGVGDDFFQSVGVERAPMQESYFDSMFRRLVLEAAQQNLDRIAWTTGEQQARRWHQIIADKIDTIQWDRVNEKIDIQSSPQARLIQQQLNQNLNDYEAVEMRVETWMAHYGHRIDDDALYLGPIENIPEEVRPDVELLRQYMEEGERLAAELTQLEQDAVKDPYYSLTMYKNGIPVYRDNHFSSELNGLIGSDMAKKIRAADSGLLTGEDITVGGHGMVEWYDRRLQDYARKFGRQFGAKVEDITLSGPEIKRYTVKQRVLNGNPIYEVVSSDGARINIHGTAQEAWQDAIKRSSNGRVEIFPPDGSTWALYLDGRLQLHTSSFDDAVEKAIDLVDSSNFASSNVVHSMEITPKMRESALKDGLPLLQGDDLGAKGAATFLDDGRAILHALTSPDVSTAVHELGHVFRRDLLGQDLETAARWAADIAGEEYINPNVWSRSMEEAFARGFERYLSDGIAPTPQLQSIFEKFKQWLVNIYEGIAGSDIDIDISPEMRRVYDRLLGGEPIEMRRSNAIDDAYSPLFQAGKDDDAFRQVPFDEAEERRLANQRGEDTGFERVQREESARGVRVFIRHMYKGDVSQVVVKELVQNAVDALRGVWKDVPYVQRTKPKPELNPGYHLEFRDRDYWKREHGYTDKEVDDWGYGTPHYVLVRDRPNPLGSDLPPLVPEQLDTSWTATPEEALAEFSQYAAHNPRIGAAFKKVERSTTGPTINLDFNSRTREITISDNGIGMPPAVARKELLNIGDTLKSEGSSGGFGVAKAAIFGNSNDIYIDTVAVAPDGKKYLTELRGTGDDWVDAKIGLRVRSTEVDMATPTGTTIKIQLEDHPELAYNPYQAQNWMQKFIDQNRIPGNMNFTFDGREINPGASKYTHTPTEHVDTIDAPGAKIDVYASKEVEESQSIPVHVLNNGLPQFDIQVWSMKPVELPSEFSVDLHMTVDPESHIYPFEISREGLKDPVKQVISHYITEEYIAKALERERNTMANGILNAPKVFGAPPGIKVYDTTGTMTDYAAKVTQRRYSQDIGTALHFVFDDLWKKIKRQDPSLDDFEFGGFGLGKGYRAVNIARSMFMDPDDKNLILVNLPRMIDYAMSLPTSQTDDFEFIANLSAEIVSASIHEMAHQQARGHDEKMTSALTAFMGFTSRDIGMAVINVEDKLRDLYRYNNSAFQEMLRDYEEYQTLADGKDLYRKVSGGYSANLRGESSFGEKPQLHLGERPEGWGGPPEGVSPGSTGQQISGRDNTSSLGGGPARQGDTAANGPEDRLFQSSQSRKKNYSSGARLADLTQDMRRVTNELEDLYRKLETAPQDQIKDIIQQISQKNSEKDAISRKVRGSAASAPVDQSSQPSSGGSPEPGPELVPTGPLTEAETREALEQNIPAVAVLSPGNESFVRSELQRRRGFIKSLDESPLYSPLIRRILEDNPDFVNYGPVRNADTLARAAKRVNADPEAALARIVSGGLEGENGLDVEADALILLRRAVEMDDLDMLKLLAQHIAPSATKAGQRIQLLSTIDDLTPEGIILRAYRRIQESVAQKSTGVTLEKLDELANEAILRQAREDALREIAAADKEVQQAKKLAEEMRRQANAILGIEPGRVTVQSVLTEVYDILFGDETLLQARLFREKLSTMSDAMAESYRNRARAIRALPPGPDRDSAKEALLAELTSLMREDIAKETERISREVRKSLTQKAKDFEYLIDDSVRGVEDRLTPADRIAISKAKRILARTHAEMTPRMAGEYLDDAAALLDITDPDERLRGIRVLLDRVNEMDDVKAWMVKHHAELEASRKVRQQIKDLDNLIDKTTRSMRKISDPVRQAITRAKQILSRTDIELPADVALSWMDDVLNIANLPPDSQEAEMLRLVNQIKEYDPVAKELSRQAAVSAAKRRADAATRKAATDLLNFVDASSRKAGSSTASLEAKTIASARAKLNRYGVELPYDMATSWLERARTLDSLSPDDAAALRKTLLDEINSYDPIKKAREADAEKARQAQELRQRALDTEALAGKKLKAARDKASSITKDTVRKAKNIINDSGVHLDDALARDWMERAFALRSMPTTTPAEKLAQARAAQSLLQEVANLIPPSRVDKLLDAWGLSRGLKSTWDLSYTLRQGILRAPGHPIEWYNMVGAQLGALLKEEAADAVDADFLFGKYSNIFQELNLSFVDRYAVQSSREELLASKFLSKYGPMVERTERAYITAGNKQRMDAMRGIINSWLPKTERGKDFKNLAELAAAAGRSEEDFRKAASWVNIVTGRGSVGLDRWLRTNGRWLNAGFFSPRFAVSRIEVPLYAVKEFAQRGPLRKIILRDLGSFIGANYGILFAMDQIPGVEVEWDPRSSDFGKIRYGDMRIDFWGGLQPVVRYFAQVVPTPGAGADSWKDRSTYGLHRKTSTGKIVSTDGLIPSLIDFIRTKFQPTVSTIADMSLGVTMTGERLDISKRPQRGEREATWPGFLPVLGGSNIRSSLGLNPEEQSTYERFLREIAADYIPFLPLETTNGFQEAGTTGAVLAAISNTTGAGFGIYSNVRDKQDEATARLFGQSGPYRQTGDPVYTQYAELPPRYRSIIDKDPAVQDAQEEAERNVRITNKERIKVSMDNYNRAVHDQEYGSIDENGFKTPGLKDLLDAGVRGKQLGDAIKEAKDSLFKFGRLTFNEPMRAAMKEGISPDTQTLLETYRNEYWGSSIPTTVTRGPGGEVMVELDFASRDKTRADILRRAVQAGLREQDVLDKKSPWEDPAVRSAVEDYDAALEKLRPYYDVATKLRANNPVFDKVMSLYESTPVDSPNREKIRGTPEYKLYNEALNKGRERLRRDLRTGVEKAGRTWLGWVPLSGLPARLP